MISLAIDIGNTSIKAGIFENHVLQTIFRFENTEGLKLYCDNLSPDTFGIISNVTNQNLSSFNSCFTELIILDHTTVVPINNHYKTPETLGNDRLAAVVGANSLYPDKNNLVIDVGTCIKYDFIDSEKNYSGGSISPGLDMKFSALNHYTQKLPRIEKQNDFHISGDSTHSALLSGVMFGSLMEMQGFIDQHTSKNDSLQVIVTGGDHAFFVGRLKGTIFAEPDLVVKGLFQILKYNVPKV